MKRSLASLFSAWLLSVLVTFSLWAQTSGAPQQSTEPGGGNASAPGQPGSSNRSQIQAPLILSGQIVVENGQPLPDISVELNCDSKSRSLQATHSDRNGFFEFVLGMGIPQGNLDMSASSDAPFGTEPVSTTLSGGNSSMASGLTGCEVRASVPGYQPLNYTIVDPSDLGRIDAGTLLLKRVGAAKEPAISVTSLQAPGNALKEFEKGESDLRSNRLKSAAEHLEKAVALYKNYATAWSDLGRVYFASHETEKAYQAFGKAIAIDPEFVSPYIGLANLQLQQGKDEAAVEGAEKALQLDPGNPMADFCAAAGDFNLDRMEAAEQHAREAETRGSIPPLHALLAEIFLEKRDYQTAAAYIRRYLKETPNGQFAEQLKTDLQQIEAAPSPTAQPRTVSPLATSSSGPTEASSPQRSNDTKFVSSKSEDSELRWIPADVDESTPSVAANIPCPLQEVVNRAGQHAKELTENLEKFSAMEHVEDIAFEKSGKTGPPVYQSFNYIVSISEPRPGLLVLDEMRKGRGDLAPGHLAENGLAGSALIFHPSNVKDFNMVCEGLSVWHGQPAWQVHFAQRLDVPARFQAFKVGMNTFEVRLKGRAWIAADTYQIEHMEEDLLEPIQQVRLAREHIVTDYRPIAFPTHNLQLWLPERVDLYLDYRGRHLYQNHKLSDFLLFSVDVEQKIAPPRQ